MAQAIWVYNMEFENTLVVTIDRQKIYETTVGGEEDMKAIDQKQDPAVDAINQRLKNIHFRTTAGPHEVAVTFRQRSFAESEDRLQAHVPGGGQDRILNVNSFEVRGPLKASGIASTPSRAHIFSCEPKSPTEETPCARSILQRLATQAYRRPVAEADVADLMAFYENGHKAGGFEGGMQQALSALLADPEFLLSRRARASRRAPRAARTRSAICRSRRASPSSYGAACPTPSCCSVAQQGKLRDEAELRKQVSRMLADPRSQSLASNFAFQWLNMAKLGEIQPDVALFPNLNGDVRKDFKEELRLFVDSVFRENRSVLDLLGANYTFLNERVALLYGIRDVEGATSSAA